MTDSNLEEIERDMWVTYTITEREKLSEKELFFLHSKHSKGQDLSIHSKNR